MVMMSNASEGTRYEVFRKQKQRTKVFGMEINVKDESD